MIIITLSQ